MFPWRMFFRAFSAMVLFLTGGFAAGQELPLPPFDSNPPEVVVPPVTPPVDESTHHHDDRPGRRDARHPADRARPAGGRAGARPDAPRHAGPHDPSGSGAAGRAHTSDRRSRPGPGPRRPTAAGTR